MLKLTPLEAQWSLPTMNQAATPYKLGWRVRIAFAFGQISEGVQSTAFGIFLLFFYNQVLGLSGQLASVAMFVALVADALIDPLIGSWSDRTRTRWGRRHPFMYLAAVPFALTFYLLFTPPQGLTDFQLFCWLAGFAVLTRVTLAMYSIPHTAMTAELSNDYDERTLLSSLRSLMGSVGTVLVMILGMRGFFRATEQYPNGQLNPEAYGAFAATFAVILVIGIWVSAAGTHDQIPRLSQAAATTKRFSLFQVVREAAEAFAISAFRTMVMTSILFGMTMGMVTALSLYLGNLYFGFTPQQLSISFPMTILGSFIGAAVATPLGRVVREKKWLLMAGLAWYALWNTSADQPESARRVPAARRPARLQDRAGVQHGLRARHRPARRDDGVDGGRHHRSARSRARRAPRRHLLRGTRVRREVRRRRRHAAVGRHRRRGRHHPQRHRRDYQP